ncbi:MAG TPA: PhoU domain-containing protein [Acidimicrobiales bacterium]|nr:PhoU domain-containing protein [Acidimicrobiales bacterium]
MPELRLEFHEKLGVVEGKVIQLFALVAEGLAAATDALLNGDQEVHRVLAEREQLVNSLYSDTEALVVKLLALQGPAAGELRFLLSVLRAVPELERSHDLVEHIARRAGSRLQDALTPRARGLVQRMGSTGSAMWRSAADSWYERDPARALAVAEEDDEMDELHAALTAELASGRIPLPVAMDMALVARFYERLGDHAANIAHRVLYLAGESDADPVVPEAGV